MWLCSGALFLTETQRKTVFKILNTKEGEAERERDKNTN